MMKPFVFAEKDKGGVIQVANIKGGVGKSTIATNLAFSFAQKGKTLLIDLDGQGSASTALGIDPSRLKRASGELLRKRFFPGYQAFSGKDPSSFRSRLKYNVNKTAAIHSLNSEEIKVLARPVRSGLDIIGGNSDLFFDYSSRHIRNLIFNLETALYAYKYIILDTPSLWNGLIRELFLFSDLNLIPITLNALVTRSLKDYLIHLNRLLQGNASVKVRIIKNEVYGNKDSKKVGKVKTMHENREFLDSLMETVEYRSKTTRLFLPEPMVFDVEIPESAAIRTTQDRGISVLDSPARNQVQTAFFALSDKVQAVLNQVRKARHEPPARETGMLPNLKLALKAAVILLTVFWGQGQAPDKIPSPLVLGRLETTVSQPIEFTFHNGESLYRAAKYAISRHRAVVPSQRQTEAYLQEVIAVHNINAPSGEQISFSRGIKPGTTVEFFPPSGIINPDYKNMQGVFEYYLKVVDDPLSYVTGLWAERGTGGSPRHEGVDVAARLGSSILSPVDGIAFQVTSKLAGRTIGIETDHGLLLFAHMNKRFVKSGERVTKGQVIGTVGMTGRTSGPHVHVGYGIRFPIGVKYGKYRYKWTDPALWFFKQNYLNTST